MSDETPSEEAKQQPATLKGQQIELSLTDYLDLRQKAESRVNWPAVITASAGAIGTILSAVALILNNTGGTP